MVHRCRKLVLICYRFCRSRTYLFSLTGWVSGSLGFAGGSCSSITTTSSTEGNGGTLFVSGTDGLKGMDEGPSFANPQLNPAGPGFGIGGGT